MVAELAGYGGMLVSPPFLHIKIQCVCACVYVFEMFAQVALIVGIFGSVASENKEI